MSLNRSSRPRLASLLVFSPQPKRSTSSKITMPTQNTPLRTFWFAIRSFHNRGVRLLATRILAGNRYRIGHAVYVLAVIGDGERHGVGSCFGISVRGHDA